MNEIIPNIFIWLLLTLFWKSMKFEYSKKYIELREKTDYSMILETANNDLINQNNVNEAYYWILHASLYLDNSSANIERGYEYHNLVTEPIWQGLTIKILGNQHTYKGEFRKAKNNYFKAKEFFEQVGEKHQIGIIYNNLGYIEEAQGNLSEALALYDQALIMDENKEKSPATILNIGKVHYKLGQLAQAMDCFKIAEKAFIKSNFIHSIVETKYRMCLLLIYRGSKDDLNHVKKISGEIEKIHNIQNQNYTNSVNMIIKGLLLHQDNSLLSKGKAMKIYNEIISDDSHNFPFKVIASKSIIELKLAEIKISDGQDEELIKEFNDLVDEFFNTIENKNMFLEMIDIQILKSKFAEVRENYSQALEELNRVNKIIKDNNITSVIPRLEDARNRLNERIKTMKEIIEKHPSWVNRIEASYIEEYLKLIKLQA